MFAWFRKTPNDPVQLKQPACEHTYKVVALVYTDQRSDYHNGHDVVSACKLLRCSKCNRKDLQDVLSKSFPVYRPEWPFDREDFVEKLENNGFVNSDDYLIEQVAKGVDHT